MRRKHGTGLTWSDEELEIARQAYLAGGTAAIAHALPQRSRDAISSQVRKKVRDEKRADWIRPDDRHACDPIALPKLPRFDSRTLLERMAEGHRRARPAQRRDGAAC